MSPFAASFFHILYQNGCVFFMSQFDDCVSFLHDCYDAGSETKKKKLKIY